MSCCTAAFRAGLVITSLLSTTMAVGQTQVWPVGGQDPATGLQVRVDEERDSALAIATQLGGAYATPVVGPDQAVYTQLALRGGGAAGAQVGWPELPFTGFFVEIPFGVDVSVEVLRGQPMKLATDVLVFPQQAPLPDDGSPAPPFALDTAAYAADRMYPSKPVMVSEPAVIRGRRVVFVQVFPLAYNPVRREVTALTDLTFALKFAGTPDLAAAARKARLATRESEALASTLILNYEPVAVADGPLGDPFNPGGADYLILVDDHLVDAVAPLAEWKQKKGLLTRVVALADIGDSPADVKGFIQSAYDNWSPAPQYVLIVGDHKDIPAAYFDGNLACHSDLAYACVDGEDYFPDLTLGRLPVHTSVECGVVVDKILRYDRTPDLGDWYSHFLAAAYFQDDGDGGSQGANDGIADRWFMETAITFCQFVTSEAGLTGHTALCTTHFPLNYGLDEYHFRHSSYPHRGTVNQQQWGADPYPDPVPTWITSAWTSAGQSTVDITSAINAGISFVIHRDHGAETLWGDPPYTVNHIVSLNNGARTPVVFSMNCSTGSFQWSGGDSFCEAFLKHPSGGAVGAVGATRTSYSGYNDLIAHGIATCFWPQYDTTYTEGTYPHSDRPAEAMNYGKYYMATFEGLNWLTEGEFYMFHWFGDPEMRMRTSVPEPLSVMHLAEVRYNAPTTVIIDVEMGGAALEGALVCLSHPVTGEHWRAYTDVDGRVVFDGITLTQRGDYDLVVTAAGALPYEGAVTGIVTSAGSVRLDAAEYSCAGAVTLEVADLDLAGNGSADVVVEALSGDVEMIVLSEVEPNSGVFRGEVTTSAAPAAGGDGVLQMVHADVISATYEDADNGLGQPMSVQDSAKADCAGPAIADVRVTDITATAIAIVFTTDERAVGTVHYGVACGAPTSTVSDVLAGTTHTLTLTDWDFDQDYYFAIEAVDELDNLSIDDNGGACYWFVTPAVLQDFPLETDPGWTTERDWAFGQPLGQGSANRDPSSGFTGPSVYGYNLAGDYPHEMKPAYLTTPPLDCTGLTNVHLTFQRWLGVDAERGNDDATIEASNDGETWRVIWRATDGDAPILDTAWQHVSHDLSAVATNQPTVWIRWGMGPTDGMYARPGWNIDDVRIIASTGLLHLELVDGPGAYLQPGRINEITVRVVADREDFVPDSALLHYRYDGGAYQSAPLAPLGGGLFRARLPVATCGSAPEFYFSAAGSLSGTVQLPPDAPATVYAPQVGVLHVALNDDFETEQGWTVENDPALTDGAWDRGIPVNCERGDPPIDFDGSGQCYLTDNSKLLGCNSDVDGGTTWLTSPRLDLSTGEARVAFAWWYTNNYGSNPYQDVMIVWVSNDDGQTWHEVETFGPSCSRAWFEHAFAVADYVTPTDAVRVRLEVGDLGQPSIVEAGVDAFVATCFACDDTPLRGDLNCDGVVDFNDINPFVLAFDDLPAYEVAYPGCALGYRDVNRDGLFNHEDITPFIKLLAGW